MITLKNHLFILNSHREESFLLSYQINKFSIVKIVWKIKEEFTLN